MESKKGISKKIIILIIAIVAVTIGVIGGSFYLYSRLTVEVKEDTLEGGNVALTYTDEENLFIIENAVPTSDLVGTELDSAELYFDFTVHTEVEEANYMEYEIILVKDDSVSTALDKNIKVYLEKEDSGSYNQVVSPILFKSNVKDNDYNSSAMSIFKYKRATSGNDNYRLRLWVADTAIINDGEIQNFGVKVAIRAIAE